jgi:hypothetical protein
MARFLVILPFVILAAYIFGIIDVVLTEERRVRALNKPLWIVLIIVLPIVGTLLWFLLGKERKDRDDERRQMAPDDDPSFLSSLRNDEEAEERIRRLEQELADLDDDQQPPKE